jgi:hypothetical protein
MNEYRQKSQAFMRENGIEGGAPIGDRFHRGRRGVPASVGTLVRRCAVLLVATGTMVVSVSCRATPAGLQGPEAVTLIRGNVIDYDIVVTPFPKLDPVFLRESSRL